MKFFLQLTLLFFGTTIYSQIKFEAGYFVTNSNERVDCMIRNSDWKDNPVEIEYKNNSNDELIKKANIQNIKEFAILNGNKYIRCDVKIEKSQNNPNHLGRNKNPIWFEETIFLKQIVEGTANLYSYTQQNLIKYFYSTPSTAVEQLVFIKYIINDSEVNNVRYNNYFRQQLFNNVKCGDMNDSDFEKIDYTRDDLKKHFLKYNSCNGNQLVVKNSNEKRGIWNLRLTLAANTVSLSFEDPNPVYNVSTDFGSKIALGFGVEGEYILPFKKNKWSVFVNPNYQLYKSEKTFTKNNGLIGGANADIEHNAIVDYANLEFPIGFRHYFFLNKNTKLFLNAGYSFNISRSTELSFESIPTGKENYDIKSSGNFLVGFGCNFKDRFSLELRLNTSRTLMGSYVYWDSSYRSVGLNLGYKIL
ncbi:outer membrane beta-barrel protein [Flavobacterium sedimenticola]|uniref:Porin family protein n=1 Tax=Flavobacterium sedimenticola TaxID=3043286 RepID=A0ABT6XQG0_9FLAO|nr:outer membrane beta-barrel protein [Flavobacterium sedimenticola]MDI9257253.1 porin family protein [Flavobacterium sedimenticola]